jgi:hypothetical protein
MKFINIPVFIISLTLGIFFVYISNPRPNVIYVYPNPDNLDDIQYKDRTGACFGFESKNVECPSNEKDIRKYPIQEGKIKQ